MRCIGLTARGNAVIERGRATSEGKLEAKLSAAALKSAKRALVALLEEIGGIDAVAGRTVKLTA